MYNEEESMCKIEFLFAFEWGKIFELCFIIPMKKWIAFFCKANHKKVRDEKI